ncbi:hypothetical protein HKX48_001074 [Thoreauomyces humboldtii]|nr:hypothetical protein HKX48_001074 [Thoreauomyces humboldtii]
MSSSANTYLASVAKRRTNYALTKKSTVPDARLQEIVQEAIKHTPTSFNSQSSRAVLLLNEHHTKVWDITSDILKAIVPADAFPATAQRLAGFSAGYGTVLFFEDETDVKKMQTAFAAYQDRFPTWSQQSSGMLQHIVWTAFTEEGLGASLQHYNPLIDEKVKEAWSIPPTWQLVALMPFGTPAAEPGAKEFRPIEERFKLFK